LSTTTGQIRDTSFIGFTEEVNKVALSAEDDKRVIMEHGIHTLAYGHYSLNKKLCDAGRTATDG